MTQKKQIALIITAVFVPTILLLVGLIGIFIAGMMRPYDEYKGEHTAEYTEAVYSLLDARGFWVDGEPLLDPYIKVLETDDKGRTMFAYSEYKNVSAVALMILQQSRDGFSYYYPDCNFTASETFKRENDDGINRNYVNDDNILSWFTTEQIEQLKSINDWNKEIDYYKCVKKEITTRKPDFKASKTQKAILETLSNKAAKDNGYDETDNAYRYSTLLDTDKYGRQILYVYGKGKVISDEQKYITLNIVIILNADNSYDINRCFIVLQNSQNYQAELKTLKENNNWNQALE